MSREASAGQGIREDSFNASSQYDQSALRIIQPEIVPPTNSTTSDAMRSQISYLQHKLTGMDHYILELNGRMSHLEQRLENEHLPIFSSQSYQTGPLLRSEAAALNKKSGPDGLSQQVLHLESELNNTNARMKDLEDLSHKNYPSHLRYFENIQDSLRILVKKELDAIIEESVRCVIENNYQVRFWYKIIN